MIDHYLIFLSHLQNFDGACYKWKRKTNLRCQYLFCWRNLTWVDIKRGVCISKNNNYSNGAQAGGSGMGLGMFSNPNCSCLKCKRAKTGEMDGNEPILSMILVFYQGFNFIQYYN